MFPFILLLSCLSNAKIHQTFNLDAYVNRNAKRQIQSNADDDYKIFAQRLNHFDPDNNETFNQRYLFEDKYYTDSHMMFLYISGEQTMSTTSISNHWVAELAEKYGAYAAALEHRYYGKSQPYDDFSTEHLKYLSSKQALADLAYFAEFLKSEYKSDDIYKIIIVGGSYSGCLAAWFRQMYPHLALGAISSSGPVEAKEDFYEYDQAVSDALDDECRERVREALDYMHSYINNTETEYAYLQNKTGCTGIPWDYRVDVVAGLADALSGAIQYNTQTGLKTKLCNIMANETIGNITERYFKYYTDYLEYEGTSCDDWSSTEYLSNITMDYDSSSRQWTYQTCTEFGYFQVAPPENNLRSPWINTTYYEKLCEYAYNINGTSVQKSINETNNFYHDFNSYATNVAFTNGENDPWARLGITPTIIYNETYNDNRVTRQRWLVQEVKGASHCTELYKPKDSDSDSLKEVRENIIDEIDAWLEWSSLDKTLTTSSPLFIGSVVVIAVGFVFCACALILCIVCVIRSKRASHGFEKL